MPSRNMAITPKWVYEMLRRAKVIDREKLDESGSMATLGAVLLISLIFGCAGDDGKTPAGASALEREMHNIGLQEAMRDMPANKAD